MEEWLIARRSGIEPLVDVDLGWSLGMDALESCKATIEAAGVGLKDKISVITTKGIFLHPVVPLSRNSLTVGCLQSLQAK